MKAMAITIIVYSDDRDNEAANDNDNNNHNNNEKCKYQIVHTKSTIARRARLGSWVVSYFCILHVLLTAACRSRPGLLRLLVIRANNWSQNASSARGMLKGSCQHRTVIMICEL